MDFIMWCGERFFSDDEKADIEAELKWDDDHDYYWKELEEFWYQFRPHTVEKDWEDLNSFEVAQLQRDFETYHELELKYKSSRYASGGI